MLAGLCHTYGEGHTTSDVTVSILSITSISKGSSCSSFRLSTSCWSEVRFSGGVLRLESPSQARSKIGATDAREKFLVTFRFFLVWGGGLVSGTRVYSYFFYNSSHILDLLVLPFWDSETAYLWLFAVEQIHITELYIKNRTIRYGIYLGWQGQ